MREKIIKDIDELADKIEELKRQGKKIVLTNGGFNLLHVGHIRSLSGAKEHGDILVVAVNSDISLIKNKGDDYPIIPEDQRIEVLSAFEYVDLVTIFSETTVDNLLLKLKPHVHAKGTDYSRDTILERETVLSYGGETVIVGDPKDHSSTNIIDKIRETASQEKGR